MGIKIWGLIMIVQVRVPVFQKMNSFRLCSDGLGRPAERASNTRAQEVRGDESWRGRSQLTNLNKVKLLEARLGFV